MTTFLLSASCHCNCNTHFDVENADLEAWKKHIASGKAGSFTCNDCGCEHVFVDRGSSIGHTPACKPRIDAISLTSGPASGGTAVAISGHCLDESGIVVKFGGVVALNMRSISAESVIVDTPAGSGVVDVSVENSLGRRKEGGVLKRAFTYAD